MTTFRDAIVDVIVKVWTEGEEEDDLSLFMAEAILAMPEMQAISAFILWVAGQWQYETDRTIAECLMDEGRLPANVIEWVLP